MRGIDAGWGAGEKVRKIAVWRSVCAAYGFVFANPVRLLRLIWPAIVPLVVFGALYVYGRPPALLAVTAVAGYALALATIVMIALAFVRAVLLGEVSWTGALRFGWQHCRFLAAGFAIFLALTLVTWIATQIMLGFAWDYLKAGRPYFPLLVGASVAIACVQLALWSALGRLILALPAIAIGEGSAVFERAWRRSRGNVWRLFLGWALCWLPFQALRGGIDRTLRFLEFSGTTIGASGSMTGFVSAATIDILGAAVTTAFYALAYAQLAQADLAQTLAASRTAPDRAPTPPTDIKSAP